MIAFHETSAGVSFAVKVQPRGKKNAIVGSVGDAVKLSLKAPPIEGRANDACIEFFANFFGCPLSSVTIIAGRTSRRKVIRISGVLLEEARSKVNDFATRH
ncbi:MAG TPA: DUF167 domain-containing protein [Terriglobales bacterium]|nr:DUF167 domain-containing protein [Terriglobales bacterium]HXY16255.1 DUF167 domain-containing protein [Terriglobales bacterium]